MYTLPDLPYAYDALTPTISEEIMRLHHTKHHQTYVDKLNAALDQVPDLKSRSLVELLAALDQVPENIRMAVRNHGGGHYNHSLFWEIMSPNSRHYPEGELADAIMRRWGSLETFIEEFNTKALSLFGSGWVWLTSDMAIMALPNQDTPMMYGKGEPLMGLDVWEHAYYLDYKNKRDEYIKNWWNVVNWPAIESRLTGHTS